MMELFGNIEGLLRGIAWDEFDLSYEDILRLINTTACKEFVINRVNKISIGGAIIVKNQARLIARAVESSLMYCDKLVVCDTGSTDGTLEVLLSYSNRSDVTIIEKEWVENYSLMRNHACEFLDTEWIFIIDSDEFISSNIEKDELKLLLAVVEYLFEKFNIVLCFKQFAEGIDGAGYPQRLFQNNKSLKFHGFVHEELRGENIINLKTELAIYNSGTSQEQSKKFNKQKRYDNLLIKNILEEPKNIKWYSLLSNEYVLNNKEWFMAAIKPIIEEINNTDKSRDYFTIKLYSIYILLQIESQKNISSIYEEIVFAIEHFYDNPIFYYYKYLLDILQMKNRARELLVSLGEDFKKMQKNYSKWDIYYPIESIESVANNLLVKAERYQMFLDSVVEISDESRDLMLRVLKSTDV